MAFRLSARSLERLTGVHPDLQKVVKLAIEITPIDFGITEGVRSPERQKQLYDDGLSKTLNSRHPTGHAVDVVAYHDGKVTWAWPAYEIVAQAFEEAAARLSIPIVWGGSWRTFKDGPHFELDRKRYP